ncbi:uncharacterized protein FA14DRAFT_169485 [Meira miltonrushii]|uniref:AB hydrolase-1 domain-containing protein n=1 Tax=Meira miltonrushii TaxID=1280837 RepID=A0A316VFV1_9BASI|nr:uncharacterized protein FA14DRAFT_169485 [Meira miltonrushii]PWN36489.1 hypothetical protein FA14DRAFT_169485 [Meira miltonrushii]
MSTFVRSVLSPLKLAPSSFTKVHVLLSPSLNDSPTNSSYLPASSLPTLVEQCPSLSNGSFTPSPQLPSGHLQTIYSTLADTIDIDVVHYTRSVLLLPESGIISLDECDHEPEYKDADRPTMVITHGLTGGSQESYVRHCIKKLALPRSEGGPGYRCIVVNFRGCANTPVTSSQLYSAAKTSDLRCAILYIRKKYPESPLVGVGYSLGANVMAKYLGEEGDNTPLLGGIVCAAPFDLKKGSDLMENNTVRRHIYSRAMNGNLGRLGTRHAATLDLNKDLRPFLDILIDPACGQQYAKERGETSGNSSKTLKFVDDCLTRMVGGYSKPYGEFPFETSDDYYNYGGALNFLKGLKRPMLALNADDDPIVSAASVEGLRHLMGYEDESNPDKYGHTDFIVLATTQGGGHLGWWQGIRQPTRWLHAPVTDFARALFNESKKQAPSDDIVNKTTTRQVLVELMPSELLPPYLSPSQRELAKETKVEPALPKQDEEYKQGARMPWLRTHVLEHAPLLHPSMARQGWQGDEPLKEKEFTVDANGSVSEVDEEIAKGWCAFEGTMVLDTKRPEVGYLELPKWTRVAGAGDHFQGGKQLAGEYGNMIESESGDGTIAGL